jgi:hypothetical protein
LYSRYTAHSAALLMAAASTVLIIVAVAVDSETVVLMLTHMYLNNAASIRYIDTDQVADEIAVAGCGHTFHHVCVDFARTIIIKGGFFNCPTCRR